VPAVRAGTPLRIFWRVHRTLMRLSGGRLGRVGVLPSLLLTTKGRTSGEARDVALSYIRDDEGYVVFASNVGQDRDPSWWKNLKAHPDATVLVDGRRIRVRARECMGARRELLWARIVERDPSYAEYQKRTKRAIPVVVLDPTPG
jgi:deazaflavin-dependent oxidoreductase (nitroreductase family)